MSDQKQLNFTSFCKKMLLPILGCELQLYFSSRKIFENRYDNINKDSFLTKRYESFSLHSPLILIYNTREEF